MDILHHPVFIATFETPVPQVILQANAPFFTIIACNKSYARSTNTENVNLAGQNLFSAFDPTLNGTEGDVIAQRGFIDAIEQKKTIYIPPHRYNLYSEASKRIEEHWWEAEVKPIIIDHEVRYIHVCMQEITDRILTGQLKPELAQQLQPVELTKDALSTDLYDTQSKFPERGFRTERYFSDLLNTIPVIAWTNNTQGEVTFFNQRWYDYTGLSFEQTKLWGWKIVIHPEDLDYNLKAYADILASETEGSFEVREKGADGTYRWHLIKMNPMRDDRGAIIMWVGTAVDIQNLKDVQQQKDEFLSIASHELRTPLTSIKAFNQFMLKTHDEAKLQGFAEKSSAHIKRLEKLISDLLDVSRINAGKMIYENTEFLFNEMLLESVHCTQLTAPKHEIVVTESANIVYRGDQVRLEQVMNNLLSNAIKYSPQGGKVLVSSTVKQNGLVVSVTDFGIGIQTEHIHRLFDRYYRIDNTAMRFEGLGLGLYIASEIIKRHKGSLWIESEQGKGSTFYFRLPLYPAQLINVEDKDDYYHDPHGTIIYNPQENRIDVKWRGFQDLQSVKTICGKLLEMATRYEIKKILADNTEVQGDTSEAVEWVGTSYYPQLERAGVKWLAWIESQSTFNKLAAQRLVEIINGEVTTRIFSEQTDAVAWLDSF